MPRRVDQAEVRVALLHRHRGEGLGPAGQDLHEPVAYRYRVVGRQQVGGVTVPGRRDGGAVGLQLVQVAVVAGP